MSGKADVTYQPDLTNPEKIAGLIEDLGFGATLQKNAVRTGEIELNVRNCLLNHFSTQKIVHWFSCVINLKLLFTFNDYFY